MVAFCDLNHSSSFFRLSLMGFMKDWHKKAAFLWKVFMLKLDKKKCLMKIFNNESYINQQWCQPSVLNWVVWTSNSRKVSSCILHYYTDISENSVNHHTVKYFTTIVISENSVNHHTVAYFTTIQLFQKIQLITIQLHISLLYSYFRKFS